MKICKQIELELTPEEERTLIKARDIIDTFINDMEAFNITTIYTDYDTYDKTKLDDIARDLHSLSTICAGE